MKILAVNLYSNKQQIQSRPAFGDSTDIGGCEPSEYERRMSSLEDSYIRTYRQIEENRLEAIKKRGIDAAQEYNEQLAVLEVWFLEQKQALKDKYTVVSKKIKKPSYIKRLFHIK